MKKTMRKKIFAFMQAALLSLTQAQADVAVKVPDVNIMPGTKAYVYINVDLGTDAYTAYQFDITYPDGISSLKSEAKDEPAFVKGNMYSDTQGVSSVYTVTGLDRFQCFSINSDPFTAQSGTLLALPVQASKTLAKGTYQATISPVEFVKTDATPDRPGVITFNIVVGDQLVLSEESIAPPLPASGVNVCVKRAIPANEWDAIVLPFSMDEEQAKEAFGDDVQLADFNGIKSTYADEAQETVTNIKVKISPATAITANRPCLIKVSEDISQFAIDGVDISPEENPSVDMDRIGMGTNKYPYLYNSLIGNYVAGFSLAKLVAEGSSPLILSSGKFVYANAATQPLKAFHAYFDFYDVLPEAENAGACIKMALDGITISEAGMATYVMPYNAVMPEGLAAYYAPQTGLFEENDKSYVALVKITGVVPEDTPVVLVGEAGYYKFEESSNSGEQVTSNMLKAVSSGYEADNYNYYKLAYAKGSTDKSTLGFYPAKPAEFVDGKAYLALPKETNAAKVCVRFNETTTSVNTVETLGTGTIYNLQGLRVNGAYKGIVIKNGHKIMNK